jgi:hypothetical protein
VMRLAGQPNLTRVNGGSARSWRRGLVRLSGGSALTLAAEELACLSLRFAGSTPASTSAPVGTGVVTSPSAALLWLAWSSGPQPNVLRSAQDASHSADRMESTALVSCCGSSAPAMPRSVTPGCKCCGFEDRESVRVQRTRSENSLTKELWFLCDGSELRELPAAKKHKYVLTRSSRRIGTPFDESVRGNSGTFAPTVVRCPCPNCPYGSAYSSPRLLSRSSLGR